MGLLSNFFGGSKSSSSPVKLDKYTPEQMKLLEGLVGQAQGGMQGPAPGSPDTYIPATGMESEFMDWARTDAAKYARGGLPYEVGDQYVNQFMESYKPIWERSRNEAMDLARAEYAGPSYYGSERMRGMGDLASQWGEKYAMTEAELRLKQDEARRAAIDQYIGVGTAGLKEGGQMERGIEEGRVTQDMNRFLRGESVGGQYDPIYNQNVQLSLALLGISPWEYGTKTKSEGAGLGYGMLTGMAQGFGSSMKQGGGA